MFTVIRLTALATLGGLCLTTRPLQAITPDFQFRVELLAEQYAVNLRTYDGRKEVGNCIAVDANGNIYQADLSGSTIRKISPKGDFSTFVGGNTAGTVDGTGTDARFSSIHDLAMGPDGFLYVGESNAIRKVSLDGKVTLFAGTLEGTPPEGFESTVNSLCFDKRGRLYFIAGYGDLYLLDEQGKASLIPIKKTIPVYSMDRHGASRLIGTCALRSTERLLDPDFEKGLLFGDFYVDSQGDRHPWPETTEPAGNSPFLKEQLPPVDGGLNLVMDDHSLVTLREGALLRVTETGSYRVLAGRPKQPGIQTGIGGAAAVPYGSGMAWGPASSDVPGTRSLYICENHSVILRCTPTRTELTPIILGPKSPGMTDSTQVPLGSTQILSVQVDSLHPASFQWLKDGQPIPGATAQNLSLEGLRRGDSGLYSVRITDEGSATADILRIKAWSAENLSSKCLHSRMGGARLTAVAAANGIIVAVGEGGTILRWRTDEGWQTANSGTSAGLRGICHGPDGFVAVGDGGTILISADGNTWSPVDSGSANGLRGIVCLNKFYLAVGETSTILRSEDAKNWLRIGTYPSSNDGAFTSIMLSDASELDTVGLPPRIFASKEQDSPWGSFDGSVWMPILGACYSVDGGVLVPGIKAGDLFTIILSSGATETNFFERYLDPFLVAGIFWTGVFHNSAGTLPPGVIVRTGTRLGDNLILAGEGGCLLLGGTGTGPYVPIHSGTSATLRGSTRIGNTAYLVGDDETIIQLKSSDDNRVSNLSGLGIAGGAHAPLILGFSVEGESPRKLLLRGIGPGLTPFVQPAVEAPRLTLFNASGAPLSVNQGWKNSDKAAEISNLGQQRGAFPAAVQDSALLAKLPRGGYSLHVSTTQAPGLGMLELYDDNPSGNGSGLPNGSLLCRLSRNGPPGILGCVIDGTAARSKLVRAVGPGLAPFVSEATIPTPVLSCYDSHGVLIERFSNWAARTDLQALADASALTGGFRLQPTSQDAVGLITLPPGTYTFQVSDAGGVAGLALIELYDVP